MKDTIRSLAATVLWTASAGLMIYGTLRGAPICVGWALYVALAACMMTGWIVADCATYRERVRVDRLVERVVDRMKQESGMPRIQR